jgi:hypothetical protein
VSTKVGEVHLEILEVFEFGGEGCMEWTIKFVSKLREPAAMCFGPSSLSLTEDESVIAKHAGDAMFSTGRVT